MKTTRQLLVALAVVAAVTSGAQPQPQKPILSFTPQSCITAGELALLQLQVASEGDLRAYFRRVNTTDWCSVEGTNAGPLSRVVLPKFEHGDEIEYFFVLIDGDRIMARSPRMYRSRVSAQCDTPFARHVISVSLNCGMGQGSVPSSIGAGLALAEDFVAGEPRFGSPDRPTEPPPPPVQ
jgi:hypothetical protein